jgi:hypothetical protein
MPGNLANKGFQALLLSDFHLHRVLNVYLGVLPIEL